MNQAQVEELVFEVESYLEAQDLDYSVSVGSHNDGEITVSVEAWEVTDDTRGCLQEIISLVEGEFTELVEEDIECYEMVMVTFRVTDFEVDKEDAEDEWEEDYE
ncbi:hypothetical protein PQE66_gp118 [Bacillus phage PBC2]|uniref:Uncharacterized protein n=1 Tax=Bacillus phage PBC2 TaxID=1675029 RepID=A0A218KC16_9CAUD|nr:hypothetical protein PQE66_gp118 [Bacillus phage PBC2]AKQ08433.1 hypothetical protein PBC2_118 [Bacillus phage PBC2]